MIPTSMLSKCRFFKETKNVVKLKGQELSQPKWTLKVPMSQFVDISERV